MRKGLESSLILCFKFDCILLGCTQIKLFVQRYLSNTLTIGNASKCEVGF